MPDTNTLCVLMRHTNCDKLLLFDEQGSESKLPLLIQNRITDTFSLPYYKKCLLAANFHCSVTKFISDKYIFEVSLTYSLRLMSLYVHELHM